MKKQKVEFIRKRHLILSPTGDLIHDFKTVSSAKRFSRSKQKSAGGLGCGIVEVDRSNDPKPPQLNFNKVQAYKSPLKSPRPVSVEGFVASYNRPRGI